MAFSLRDAGSDHRLGADDGDENVLQREEHICKCKESTTQESIEYDERNTATILLNKPLKNPAEPVLF